MRRRRGAAAAAALTAAVLLAAGCTAQQQEQERQEQDPPAVAAAGVGVQLFQWTWDAIASECERTLGPAGYGWVMTSPPQEHIVGEQWWTSYQPVSYLLESRLGTRDEFAAMVSRCRAAGVEVYADAVVNHMTGGDDTEMTGWAGSTYSHEEYPGIWSTDDFHHCGLTPDDDIADYSDAEQVQTCELLNLADLATEDEHVRERLGEYLADLVSLGVTGLRIDAAKHMPPEDLAAIVAGLPDDVVILQEVIRGDGEPVTPEQYVGNGLVYEFAWGRQIATMLGPGGSLAGVAELGTSGMLPSESAVTFVDNHDTERNRSTLDATDGADYALANVLLLASGYGTPVVFSGYAFSDTDAGPPQDEHGEVLDAVCPADVGPAVEPAEGAWVCTHAWPLIEGMVGFHDATLGLPVVDVWEGEEQVAFGRGDAGFVVVNTDAEPYAGTWTTSLPAGRYCDVAGGPMTEAGCPGQVVEVAGDGSVSAEVGAGSALALHVDART